MKQTTLLLAILLLLTLLLIETECRRRKGKGGGRRRHKRYNFKCSDSSVAEYKLTFHGLWTEEAFPRMYPKHRPPAQWSKLIGRSHAPTYHMWQMGHKANLALKRFAEEADSSWYDSVPQGYQGVFDTFQAEPVTSGEGWTSTFLTADGRHSRVSFLVKLVPSPDWFVGVDSLELCKRGRWRARAVLNLWPLDSGTDSGYTFTAPNWPSIPPEPVYQITSSYPNHPASSFLYPDYRRLPRIGWVEVQRMAQYFRKGPADPLRANRTLNVKVFGNKAESDNVDDATTTVSSIAGLSSTVAQVLKEDDAAVVPNSQKVMEDAAQPIINSRSGFAAAHSLIHQHPNQQRLLLSAVISAATQKTTASPSVTSPTKAVNEKGKLTQPKHLLSMPRLDQTMTPKASLLGSPKVPNAGVLRESSPAQTVKIGEKSNAHQANMQETVASTSSVYIQYDVQNDDPQLLKSLPEAEQVPKLKVKLSESALALSRNLPAQSVEALMMTPASGKSRPSSEDTTASSHLETTDSQSYHVFEQPRFAALSAVDPNSDNKPVDCTVAQWSPWSSCTKSCGYGIRTRSRDVLAHAKNTGLPCPLLQEEVLCGSMTSCQWNHFSFLANRKQPRRIRRRRHRQHEGHRNRKSNSKRRLRLK